MSRPLQAEAWYRIAGLRPRLRAHARLHRHEYRGQVWYVVEERVGGRHHRFNLQAWRVLQLMDGNRTLEEIWTLLTAEGVTDETPTQPDLIRLLGTLHTADLFEVDITPDVAELLERRGRQMRRRWFQRVGNPIALRIPVFDPDALLDRIWLACGRRGRTIVALWLAVVIPALALLPSQWNGLTATSTDQLLAAGNLVTLALLFPLVKLLHELGHGLACKAFGVEVRETGVMLLVLYPVPYVDASGSVALANKWQRALVGAAGMLTELFIAAVAFYLWLLLEPGVARGIAFDVAVLAGLTTLVFNANPLLRFDGYFILSDLIEVPGLAQRANRLWQYLTERYVFGVRRTEPPQATPGERRWFLGYAPLSYAYRLFIAFTIAFFVAGQFFVLGVLIALWAFAQALVWPVVKGLKALVSAPQFADRGPRIRAVLATGAALVALLLFVLPLPYHTLSTGVLWVPERAIVRAQSNGFIRELRARPGTLLAEGDPVLEMVAPELAARVAVQRAKLEELQAQYDAAWGTSQAKAQQIGQQVGREQAALARLENEASRLTLRAGMAGRLLLDRPDDLPGRYLKQGEVVGYLRVDASTLVRLVVTQAEVDRVRLDARGVEVRFPQDTSRRWPATLARATPAAIRELPSAVLGAQGGGPVVTDPRDEKGVTAVESVFEFELSLAEEVPHELLGSKVHVRIEHSPEPVGFRLWRALRRSFLSQFRT